MSLFRKNRPKSRWGSVLSATGKANSLAMPDLPDSGETPLYMRRLLSTEISSRSVPVVTEDPESVVEGQERDLDK